MEYGACMTNSMGQTDRELEEDEENGATARLWLVAQNEIGTDGEIDFWQAKALPRCAGYGNSDFFAKKNCHLLHSAGRLAGRRFAQDWVLRASFP